VAALILLRHGQSEWNLANRFTGWIDVDLSPAGEREAEEAGRAILEEAFEPDVVHTSLQKRAIRSAEIALRELDRLWIPVRRSWRLNERHYGGLQGMDKKETTAEHGLDQVKRWRRSYDTSPPPLDKAEWEAQRRDPRYASLPDDVLPYAECLKDVVARVLPYWYDAIVADLRTHETVLVSAHGNSLRALIKHLDRIPDAKINELEIPTGVPLLYELDVHMVPVGSRYLGDPEAANERAEEVRRQAG
jgi:2,3-bisphosphoglycerate-dependent phosphoglycerate mutase